MTIVCPHCNFSREVPDGQIPDRPVKVTCPKCQQGFGFDKSVGMASPPAAAKPDGTAAGPECTVSPEQGEVTLPGRSTYASVTLADERPKAGFWIRGVAYLIDTMLLGAVQGAIALALSLSGNALIGDGNGDLAMTLIGGLCGMVVGITYAVFFTGYNGQTPGKMALRIQVIRSDGTPMTYGRAFLREVIGKFASGIIFGIGYLMAGFDRQKQGLHDKIAGTYVIKL